MTLGYPRDWTEQGVGLLSLWFQGRPAGMVEEPAGTYTMTGAGADIWGSSDQFRYAYKQLSGDTTIIARVVDNGTGSNNWAKGGVMIRQSVDAGSNHTFMPITGGGGNGASFQGRSEANASSWNHDSGEVVAPPYWVKLERVGNDFSGSISPDGVTWTQLGGAETVVMTDPVLIGLAVTSHASGENRTYTFDNISTTDAVSGEWQVAAIGADMPSNDPAPMYVAVANSDGTTAVVYNDNPNAATIGDWTEWAISLQDFADQGVDLTDVDKISIGFGDKDNLQVGGSGIVFFDDIRLTRYVYTYDGDAAIAGEANSFDSLDGTWDHDNGSDQWDGSVIGEGMPGGAVSLTEDGVTFLRIQDTGDPRDYGNSDPTNRKVYFTHLTDGGLDGATLEVRIRVATTAPLDDAHPDGGAGIEPWPEGGIGYHIRDGGKGMFGISDGVGVISFSLAKAGEPDFEAVATDVLVTNNLVGTEPSGDVDTGESADLNVIAIDDATQWNTFTIDIAAGGAGTHIVTVSVNGGPAESFEVTAGTDTEGETPYITIGSSGTGGITAFDLDYITVSY